MTTTRYTRDLRGRIVERCQEGDYPLFWRDNNDRICTDDSGALLLLALLRHLELSESACEPGDAKP